MLKNRILVNIVWQKSIEILYPINTATADWYIDEYLLTGGIVFFYCQHGSYALPMFYRRTAGK